MTPDASAAGGVAAELSRAQRRVHARLSAFYFLYYVAVGAFVPYWPLYLQSLGYSPAQIGVAFAVVGLVRAVMPVAWGWLMDHSNHRMPWIAGGMLVACAFFCWIPFTQSFASMLALHFAYALFWNAALPAFDVVTLSHIAHTGGDYSRIRLWGSVGFIVAVAVLGPVLDVTGLGPVPWIVAAGMIGMGLLGATIPDAADHPARQHVNDRFLDLVRRPAVLCLLLVCFLSQVSFAPFYGFFSLYLERHHYDRTTIGALWALGVMAEVIVFIYAGRLIARFGSRAILLIALLSTSVRWALLLFVDQIGMLALSQLLHLSSFALYQAVSVYYIHRIFPARQQGRGQALLAAVSFGLGGSVGSFLGGQIWEQWSPMTLYACASAVAALGFWVAQRSVPDASSIVSRPART